MRPASMPRAQALITAALAGLLSLLLSLAPSQAAATAGGQLFAFGLNGSGQLGNATNVTTGEPNPTPTAVSLPGATGPVVQAAVGQAHSLAVTSTGQLYSFGENQSGQLGVPANSGTPAASPTPALVSLPGATGPVSTVAAGANFSLVATSTGQLYAFGENYYGQLGNTTNENTHKANPTPTLVALPAGSGPVTGLAAGADSSLVVTATGKLYAFGRNQFGELGSATHNGTAEPNPAPTLVGLPGATGLPIEVSVGESYGLAVTSTGQLYAFGENLYGQLGLATGSGTSSPNPTPTLVSLPGATGAVSHVAAGAFHALALTTTGQLYGFGSNFGGQLGNAVNTESSTPNPTPTLVSLPGASAPASDITAAYNFSLALTASGQLYGFGLNRYGQIGSAINNGTAAANPLPSLVGPPLGMTFAGLGHGPYAEHTLAIAAPTPPVAASPPPTTSSPPVDLGAAARALTARLKASLLAQLAPRGRGARLGQLAKKGYAMPFSALSAGTLLVSWYYVPRGAHLAKKPVPLLVAAGKKRFPGMESSRLTLKPTPKGLRLLRSAKRLKLTAKGLFTRPGQAPIVAIRSFTLSR